MQLSPARFLATHRVFTRQELIESLTRSGGRTSNAVQSSLEVWLREGRVRSVKRGVFVRSDLRLERDPQAREGLRTMAALYLADAVAQALGLTLTIIGHVQRARDPHPRPRRIAVAPSLTGPGAGLAMSGTF